MPRTHAIAFFLAAVVVSSISATQAHAAQRTFVSATIGNDANSATGCAVTAPCRFFQTAVAATDASGEVIVLDSGEYGGVDIIKSISLIAPPGVFAGISGDTDSSSVTIHNTGVNVMLRGLTIHGNPSSFNGINMVISGAGKLTVRDCLIYNMGAHGIFVEGTNTARIIDTIVRDNGGNGIYIQNGANATITRVISSGNGVNNSQGANGIYVEGKLAGTTTTVDITDSTTDGNWDGVNVVSRIAGANVLASVRNSRTVRNFGSGMSATSGGPGTSLVRLTASNNIVSNNNVGIQAGFAGTTVVATGNTVTGNSVAGFQNIVGGSLGNAFFRTGVDNAVRNNAVDVSGTVGSSTPR